MRMCLLLRESTPNYFTGHVCKQTISEITLVVGPTKSRPEPSEWNRPDGF